MDIFCKSHIETIKLCNEINKRRYEMQRIYNNYLLAYFLWYTTSKYFNYWWKHEKCIECHCNWSSLIVPISVFFVSDVLRRTLCLLLNTIWSLARQKQNCFLCSNFQRVTECIFNATSWFVTVGLQEVLLFDRKYSNNNKFSAVLQSS